MISEYNAGPSDDIKADIWKGREKLFEHHKNVRFFRQNLLVRARGKGFLCPMVFIPKRGRRLSVFGKIERDKRLYDLKSLFGLGFKGFYKKTRAYPFFP